ncbi:MAG: hypothetical protein AAF399_19125 [Bacteroidota bacterium]
MKISTIITSFVLSFFFVQIAAAQNVWTGSIYAGGNDWHNPNNWSKGHVPTDMEDVVIPDLSNTGKPYPVISHEAEANHVRILGQARLNVAAEGNLYLAIMEGFATSQEMEAYTAADSVELTGESRYSSHHRTASLQ